MPVMCTSILTYTLCGHKKYFDRPCHENFGGDGRKCSPLALNIHTTQQIIDKWPCLLCRTFAKMRRQIQRERAGNDSTNVTFNGMGTLQGDINKDLQTASKKRGRAYTTR
ncbi:hypothetical protein E4U57_001924 [Claviceps arundinis]|uniref:Uncharacterized protein n=1 Tax=Claviceps arundinis TaxID=1623583 RepID=A0ABQ7P9I5_9HYPO|nr:hypothetical protein E4U57_001924 [Claviceps arundinis]